MVEMFSLSMKEGAWKPMIHSGKKGCHVMCLFACTELLEAIGCSGWKCSLERKVIR